jgi:hypothetical protein
MAEEKDKNSEEARDVTDGNINVTIEPDDPKNFCETLTDIRDKASNLSRMSEQGIVNEITGSAVVVRTDGQINLSASKFANIRINPNGKVTDQSLESETITNRKKFTTDEFVINEHKLNPQLWELADMRKQKLLINQNVTIGNLTMSGHVLVKVWEPNLKRYVLIRRPWRGPVFGPLMNVPEIHPALAIFDPLKLEENILALSDKGYQVNGAIKDAKSLIGKDGVDRQGSVARNTDALSGSGAGAAAQVSYDGKMVAASANAASIFKALRECGYNDIVACGIMGNLQQESGLRPDSKNKDGYTGIAQWDPVGRWPNCVNFCQAHGKDPFDVGAQISFLYYEATTTRFPEECSPRAMNAKCTDVSKAVHEWLEWFEGASGQEEGERNAYAAEFWAKFKGQ